MAVHRWVLFLFCEQHLGVEYSISVKEILGKNKGITIRVHYVAVSAISKKTNVAHNNWRPLIDAKKSEE